MLRVLQPKGMFCSSALASLSWCCLVATEAQGPHTGCMDVVKLEIAEEFGRWRSRRRAIPADASLA
jgi:hypothetical protein